MLIVAAYIQIFALCGHHMIDFLHERFEELINAVHEHQKTALCTIWTGEK